MEISLVFPHQLFDPHPALAKGRKVLLVEDSLFFGNDRHWPLNFHAQKRVLHRATMTHWMQTMQSRGYEVTRVETDGQPTTTAELLAPHLKNVSVLHVCEVVDHLLNRRLRRLEAQLVVHETPMFLSPLSFIDQQLGSKKKPFMAAFYQAQRKRLGILLDADGGPLGGQWSYDTENRQKLPKGLRAPALPVYAETEALTEAKAYVATKFPQALGNVAEFRWPVTREQALQELEAFLEQRLVLFGHYEDAISVTQPWLYHSTLTAPLNIGLITPQEIIDRTLDYASEHEVPLNSLEGFIRQIIGWREFMRGIYHLHGVKVRNGNYWQHREPMPASFYDGTSGITPVDSVIRRLHNSAYCHHIERLMVLGNIMVLKQIEPHAVYRWFMEFFIDAYDWVMVPNVYGMSQFADGGTFTTKPYISGSNYVLKMSDHPKGLWCGQWDSLFWDFIGRHREFFLKNPRMSMMVRQWDKRQAAT